MKKMITLPVALMFFIASYAQYTNNNQRNEDYNRKGDYSYNERNYKNDRDYNNRYNFSTRERDMQIEAINREYDKRIASVNHRWLMRRTKKDAVICTLEQQRREDIRNVYERFSNRSNRHNDYDYGRRW